MRVLFLSSWFPYPPDNGSRMRVFNLLKQLSQEHTITLLSFSQDGAVSEERLKAMHEYCSTVQAIPLAPFRPNSLRSILGLLSTRPRSLVDRDSQPMRRLVDRVSKEQDFAVVIASQLNAAPYAASLENMPRILEEVELTTLREKFHRQSRVSRRLRYGLMWWKSRRFTVHLLRRFDGCTVVSQQERANVLHIAPDYKHVIVVPNGVDLAGYTGDFGSPEPDTLIFPGALTYGANFDAMAFFLQQVFPLVRARHPDAILRITGKTEGVPVERLPLDESVILTGYLDDVRPTLAQSRVCVVPLRIGGGTRLKILEAMALGTPVVATSKGAEGIDARPGKDLLIADGPTAFAEAIVRLLTDQTLYHQLSRNGRQLVRKRYDWKTIGARLNALIKEIVARYRSR